MNRKRKEKKKKRKKNTDKTILVLFQFKVSSCSINIVQQASCLILYSPLSATAKYAVLLYHIWTTVLSMYSGQPVTK